MDVNSSFKYKSQMSDDSDSVSSDFDSDSEQEPQQSLSNTCEQTEKKHKNLVTMKMIDFAHSTFEGFMEDPVVHIGPDLGYIKGIDTLISTLIKAMEQEACL